MYSNIWNEKRVRAFEKHRKLHYTVKRFARFCYKVIIISSNTNFLKFSNTTFVDSLLSYEINLLKF